MSSESSDSGAICRSLIIFSLSSEPSVLSELFDFFFSVVVVEVGLTTTDLTLGLLDSLTDFFLGEDFVLIGLLDLLRERSYDLFRRLRYSSVFSLCIRFASSLLRNGVTFSPDSLKKDLSCSLVIDPGCIGIRRNAVPTSGCLLYLFKSTER